MKCVGCKYFRRPAYVGSDCPTGDCYRYPPVLERGDWIRPIVLVEDFCGEWTPKNPPDWGPN